MRLDFVKVSPAKNTTAFITNYVNPIDYVKIANTIMDYEYIHAEQVGFLVAPKEKDAILRLEMSGGELCGNAVLSAAAYCHYKGLCKSDTFLLETSGVQASLSCEVNVKSPVLFEAKAEMPGPLAVDDLTIQIQNKRIPGSVVQLEGITHFVTANWLEEHEFPLVLKELSKYIDNKAIGIIPYKALRGNQYEICPFVFVNDTGSTFFERSCGSGTLALGIHLAPHIKESQLDVYQLGGVIRVEIGEKKYISTTVRFTCEGIVYLPF